MTMKPLPRLRECYAARSNGSPPGAWWSNECSVITGRVTGQSCGSTPAQNWASSRKRPGFTGYKQTARSNASTARSLIRGPMPGVTSQKPNAATRWLGGHMTTITTASYPMRGPPTHYLVDQPPRAVHLDDQSSRHGWVDDVVSATSDTTTVGSVNDNSYRVPPSRRDTLLGWAVVPRRHREVGDLAPGRSAPRRKRRRQRGVRDRSR